MDSEKLADILSRLDQLERRQSALASVIASDKGLTEKAVVTACVKGDVEVVRALLESGVANVNGLYEHRTMMSRALKTEDYRPKFHPAVVHCLLDFGADVRACDSHGNAAGRHLVEVSCMDNPEKLGLLLRCERELRADEWLSSDLDAKIVTCAILSGQKHLLQEHHLRGDLTAGIDLLKCEGRLGEARWSYNGWSFVTLSLSPLAYIAAFGSVQAFADALELGLPDEPTAAYRSEGFEKLGTMTVRELLERFQGDEKMQHLELLTVYEARAAARNALQEATEAASPTKSRRRAPARA